ncbi:glutathione S-transferase C-terminal domain-containing protein homolog isoform X2 [Ostrea edulis]|uniref:glutathione S-transferase C-terminal domain-containing protein homolog isoform X2 n=1 Tax=Ostrea edulis TaxID=37623 RepID=UPI0024AF0DEC|nr:glutathione S-transferase C-terminal domain-containing protein homolog isoform X2 [Ostrea edulis]
MSLARTAVYISGRRSDAGTQILLPLPSAAVVFLIHYCDCDVFELVFVDEKLSASECVSVSFAVLLATKHTFTDEASCPHHCDLPVVCDDSVIRSGLCSTLRCLIKKCHANNPEKNLHDLLGFRGGSLKACAEISGWTKLCEIELPSSVTELICNIRSKENETNTEVVEDIISKENEFKIITKNLDKNGMVHPSKDSSESKESDIALPEAILKLEWHFMKSPSVHNDDKIKRALLSQLKQEVKGITDPKKFRFTRDIPHSHCVNRFRIKKPNQKYKTSPGDGLNGTLAEKHCITSPQVSGGLTSESAGARETGLEKQSTEDDVIDLSLTELNEYMSNLTIHEIQFVHLYSEGMDITVSDMVLFTYIYFLLQSVNFDMMLIMEHLPLISQWFRHMIALPEVRRAAVKTQCDLDRLSYSRRESTVKFYIPDWVKPPDHDEMELSRRLRGKYRAIKPDITKALNKIKNGNIEVEFGSHPRGDQVQLDWESFPARVDPGIDLPKKRRQRKCQQLESLATAVLEIHRPGDVIVDFCSGGGHLGIVIAYLLPDCKIYLVENNEDSLIRARSRIKDLKLQNVTIFQCNQDYFHEKFDLGVCLHACGVATDMVLKQCIRNEAQFVICPCCYGGIQDTHFITYPRSQRFRDAEIEYKEFLTLGHVADQTEFNMALEEQGKYCMNLVDMDRSHYAREHGYKTALCSLKPLSCTPKNNLLIGQNTSNR